MATFSTFGPSFTANGVTSCNQTSGIVTRLADNTFVQIYTSADVSGQGTVLRLAHFLPVNAGVILYRRAGEILHHG